jgi:hypothetical protein
VRQEAVQQALAAMQSKSKPTVPMPSKRSSVMKSSQHDSGEAIVYTKNDFVSVIQIIKTKMMSCHEQG